ncbi:hypothetical protein [Ramlibacter montanisoli]|uniref:Uncharacterized protein n=1 Tax=Ramlibacter montanisoli TaxID=2732512 RepID=A0A849KE15_9BURK|nr:hypothetical protein [Ramlibacter montanisoli]NNU43716.1 hypothetical protein [Ramlibacter montanisoli]
MSTAAAITMSKNGTTAMNVTGVTGSGTAHVEMQTDQVLAPTDWVFLQYTGGTTVADSLSDTAGNLLQGDDPALYGGSAEGGAGNNIIDISGRSASVEYDINGYAGDDVLVGSGGNEFITGGTGADRMTGNAGTDEFQFNQGDSTPVAVNLGGDATLNTGDTFTFTGGADVVTDLSAGDAFSMQGPQSGYMGSLPANGLAAEQAFYVVRGEYSAGTGTFLVDAAAGTDSLVVYDGTSGTGVTQTAMVLEGTIPDELNLFPGSTWVSHKPVPDTTAPSLQSLIAVSNGDGTSSVTLTFSEAVQNSLNLQCMRILIPRLSGPSRPWASPTSAAWARRRWW